MSVDIWIAFGTAALSCAFYTGGFVLLTQNHLKHFNARLSELKVSINDLTRSVVDLKIAVAKLETLAEGDLRRGKES